MTGTNPTVHCQKSVCEFLEEYVSICTQFQISLFQFQSVPTFLEKCENVLTFLLTSLEKKFKIERVQFKQMHLNVLCCSSEFQVMIVRIQLYSHAFKCLSLS